MAKSKKLSGKAAAIFLFIFGSVFALVGATFTYFSYDFTQHAKATTGTVLEVHVSYSSSSSSSGSSNSPTYKPIIAYIDANGAKYTGQTFLSSSSYNYPIGSKVGILYDPRAPQNIRIDSWFALWGFGLIFLFVGIGTEIGGIFALRAWMKNKTKASGDETEAEAQPTSTYSYQAEAPDPEPKRKSTVQRKR